MVKSEAAKKPKVGKRLLIDDGEEEPGVSEAKLLRPGAAMNGGASAGEQAKPNKMLDFLLKERSSLTT